MGDGMEINVNNEYKKGMVVGFVGFISAGKDTAADYLVNFHGFRRDSFANTLKDAVANVFGWDRTLLEGRTAEAREWREQVDEWWANRLGMPELTPRWVLQYWGTEVCRYGFHEDIWIASTEYRLHSSKDNIVISDCRFPNEIQSIRQSGGKVVWIQRGKLPEWYELAVQANTTPPNSEMHLRLIDKGVHISETAWIGTKFDAIIENNGTVEELFYQLKNLV
jgi:hypothetical protein